MKNIHFRSIITATALCVCSSLVAQAPLLSVEAEDFISAGFQGSGGGASAEPRIEGNLEGASNGKYVRGISNSNTILFNFYVEKEGAYKLAVRYNCTKEESAIQGPFITTRINNQVKVGPIAVELTPNDGEDKPTFGTMEQLVYCETGWNRLIIGAGGNGKYTARIDKWDLFATNEAYVKPAVDEAAPYTKYDATIDNKYAPYKFDLGMVDESVTLENNNNNSTFENLLDKDFTTHFTSTRDQEVIRFKFVGGAVVRQMVLGNVLRLGQSKLEYSPDGEVWTEWTKNESFTQLRQIDGTSIYWMSPYASGVDAFVDNTPGIKYFRLTLNKAPGAPNIDVSEVLLWGNLCEKNITEGTSTLKYMGDDITIGNNGAWFSLTKTDGTTTVQEEAVSPYSKGSFGALDNAYNTKFSVPSKGFILTYKFNESANVTQYWIGTATSAKRFIKTWKLQGSNDNENYTDLHSVTDMSHISISNSNPSFNQMLLPSRIINDKYYKYYRLFASDNNGDSGFSEISDFMLFGNVKEDILSEGLTDKGASQRITTTENGVTLYSEDGLDYSIFNSLGQCVRSYKTNNTEEMILLGRGIYSVVLNGKVTKLHIF